MNHSDEQSKSQKGSFSASDVLASRRTVLAAGAAAAAGIGAGKLGVLAQDSASTPASAGTAANVCVLTPELTDLADYRISASSVDVIRNAVTYARSRRDVIEPEHDLVAIGSGGPFAQAAARALADNTDLDARTIVERSLNIAADICIYTNRNLVIEELKG